jgi:membrane-associated phospholipid phosphatase
MLAFEYLAAFNFAALAVAAGFGRSARHLRAATLCACAFAAVLLAVRFAPLTLRAWLPHGYLVAGYWLPALLVEDSAAHSLQQWLRDTDAATVRRLRVPRQLRGVLELCYLLCYPIVPLAFGVVLARGHAEHVTRFWVAVLMSGFVCYGSLPWLTTRPPRLLEGVPAEPHWLATFNASVLHRVSHQLNTFPSGHVAVSLAAALAVLDVSWSGVLFVLVAIGVAIGAVVGRYHYLVDVLLGVVVALGATWLSAVVG